MATSSLHERFTEAARRSMGLANEQAKRLGHAYIGTEHMLLGILKEGSGVAAQVLRPMGVDFDAASRQVEALIGQGPSRLSDGKLPTTPRARGVIADAVSVARQLGHDYVGTEHLLLALLREREGVGLAVLLSLGLTPQRVHRETLRFLTTMPRSPHGGPGPLVLSGASPPAGAEPLGLRLARLEAASRTETGSKPSTKLLVGALAIFVLIVALAIYAAARAP